MSILKYSRDRRMALVALSAALPGVIAIAAGIVALALASRGLL